MLSVVAQAALPGAALPGPAIATEAEEPTFARLSFVEDLEHRGLMSWSDLAARPPILAIDSDKLVHPTLAVDGSRAEPIAVAAKRRSQAVARLSHGGTLQVVGTAGPDRITFAEAAESPPDGGVEYVVEVQIDEMSFRFMERQVNRIIVNGGPGDDNIDGTGARVSSRTRARFPVTLNGGPGNDRLSPGGRLIGGPGNDVLLARNAFTDFLFGGPGNDQAQVNPPSILGRDGDAVRGVETLLP